jgi:hypothetical protein
VIKNFDAIWGEIVKFVTTSVSSYRGFAGFMASIPLLLPFLAEIEWELPAAIIGLVLAMVEGYKPALRYLEEDIESKTGLAKLDPQAALEAWRRNFITEKQVDEELAVNGWDAGRRDILKGLQNFLLSTTDIIELWFRKIVTEADMRENLLDHGVSKDNQDAIIAGAYRLFDVPMASTAFLRKLILEDQLDAILRANRYTDAEIETYKAVLIAPGGLNTNVFRERFAGLLASPLVSNPNATTPPSDLFERSQALGVSTEEAEAAWYGSYTVPSIREWLSMYHRGLIDRRQLDAAFDFYRVLPEWRNNIIGDAASLIPFRTIPAMLKAGIIDEPYARQQLRAHGFDLPAIEALLKYAKIKASTTKSTTAKDLHNISLATVKEFWLQGAITDAQYLESLQAHGYDDATAKLQLQVETNAEHAKERRQIAQSIIDESLAGLITDDQAQQQLVNNGFTVPEIAKYVKQLRTVKRANTKTPSETELKAFLKAGVITLQDYADALGMAGYAQKWVDAFTELNGGLAKQPVIATP